MKTTISILITLFIFSYGQAQNDWRIMMNNPNSNFYDIQNSFYSEFGDQPGTKGSGWKQFKRWEYYYQDRIDENGNMPKAGSILKELKDYDLKHPNTKGYTVGTGNWTELGPIAKPVNGTSQPNGNGRLNCIAFHPTDPNTLYVGAPSGGFWKSTDHGVTWSKSITGLTRLGISSIVVHPTTPNIIYIGTGDRDAGDAPGYGVWKSTDGGATWAPSNTGMGDRTVYEILMDPTNSARLIASTPNGRIYRSLDSGVSWTYSLASNTSCKDIALKPGDPNTIYAAGNKFYVSTDGGVSFTETTTGLSTTTRYSMAVSANQPNWVFLLSGNSSGLVGVYQSTNSGSSFVTQATTPNLFGYGTTGGTGSQASYDNVLAADPTNANVLYAGGINIWKSSDAGVTWSLSGHWVGSGADDVHADQHAMEFSPHTNVVYNGNDGGIYYTPDLGTTWTEISSGLGIAQVYKIGVAQSVENTIINGYQDNGTGIYYDGIWNTEIGGDGMECIIDPSDANYMYGALYFGDIRRSTNNGVNFSVIADNGVNGINESGAWVTPYKLDPNNPARMFAGYDNIWRSDDVKSPASNAIIWTSVSSFGGTSNIADIAISPSNSNVMYVSRSLTTASFYSTTNALGASPTWTDLDASLPVNLVPKDIEIDPTDPTHLFIALGNKIYESTNSGAAWIDFSGTLPNISLNTIVIDHNSPVDAMYVGMDAGVYYRDNTMTDWTLYSTGLPKVEVSELEIYNNSTDCKSKLYASTYGQGLWTSDLKEIGGLAPVACFESTVTDLCTGSANTFTDISDHVPTSWLWSISPATFTFTGGSTAASQSPQIIFNAAGTYTIALTATNATGSDTRTKAAYINVGNSNAASTMAENLEAETLCATTTDCETTICSLGGLWKNLNNGTEDNIDWRVDEGGTPSSGTGPSVDKTLGSSTGNYIYLETSGTCNNQIAILESECIILDVNYDFELWYHMYGTNMGSLHVDILVSGSWIEDIITPISGNQGDVWQQMVVDLSTWTGENVNLRVRGISGTGFESDIALDELSIVPQSTLPIDLINFSAEVAELNKVHLTWETASEINNNYFIIERSNNGYSWEELNKVQGNGNSNSLKQYELYDNSPLNGVSYYRLKQVNLDESFAYSNIRAVEIKEIKIYPNPADQEITLEGVGIGNFDIRLYNIVGQYIIIQPIVTASNISISTNHLPNGVYFMELLNNGIVIDSQKIIVKHND